MEFKCDCCGNVINKFDPIKKIRQCHLDGGCRKLKVESFCFVIVVGKVDLLAVHLLGNTHQP